MLHHTKFKPLQTGPINICESVLLFFVSFVCFYMDKGRGYPSKFVSINILVSSGTKFGTVPNFKWTVHMTYKNLGLINWITKSASKRSPEECIAFICLHQLLFCKHLIIDPKWRFIHLGHFAPIFLFARASSFCRKFVSDNFY